MVRRGGVGHAGILTLLSAGCKCARRQPHTLWLSSTTPSGLETGGGRSRCAGHASPRERAHTPTDTHLDARARRPQLFRSQAGTAGLCDGQTSSSDSVTSKALSIAAASDASSPGVTPSWSASVRSTADRVPRTIERQIRAGHEVDSPLAPAVHARRKGCEFGRYSDVRPVSRFLGFSLPREGVRLRCRRTRRARAHCWSHVVGQIRAGHEVDSPLAPALHARRKGCEFGRYFGRAPGFSLPREGCACDAGELDALGHTAGREPRDRTHRSLGRQMLRLSFRSER